MSSVGVGRLRDTATSLWPDAAVRVRRRPVARADETYVVLPSMRRPRLLVPTGSRRVARSAIANSSVGSGALARRFRAALARAAGLGLLEERLPHRRLVVTRARHDPGVAAWVRTHTDLRPSSMSVRIGSDRANAKPVAQMMEPDGRVTAYTKIGTSALTRRLVRGERAALEHVRAVLPRQGGVLRPPRVLASGHLGNRELLVLEAFDLPLQPTAREATLVAAMAEIAALGIMSEQPLGASAYAEGLVRRVAALEEDARRTVGPVLAAILERHDTTRLRFGAWHGDFRPWNVAWDGRRLLIWDWERFAKHVPLGLDAIHHHHRPPVPARPGVDAEASRRQDTLAARPMLDGLGVRVDEHALALLAGLHLLELVLRHLDDVRHAPHVEERDRWMLLADLAAAAGT